MKLRNLTITVAVLAALCVVAWFARRPAPPASADPRVGQPLLATDIASQAARVRITDRGKTVELARGSDGSWTVASYHDFPADFEKLGRLVNDLAGAKIERLVTSRADRLERLEFKDTTVALLDAAGTGLWQVTLGKNAGGGGRFLRFGTEEKGYLANLSLFLDSEPKSWADTALLNLKAADIARVEIGFVGEADPPVVASREKPEDPWTAASTAPDGKRLKNDRITSTLSSLVNLRFSDTTAPDDPKAAAARAHRRTIKLTTFDGQTWSIALDRTPEEKRPKPALPETPAAPVAPDASSSLDKDTAGETEASSETPAKEEPEFETIPAGPVFATVTSSDASARINALMEKRAFQVAEWTYTGLPATPADLWEDAPPPAVDAPPDQPGETAAANP